MVLRLKSYKVLKVNEEVNKILEEKPIQQKEIPLILRVFGALNVIFGVIAVPFLLLAVIAFSYLLITHDWSTFNEVTVSNQALVLRTVGMFVFLVQTSLFIVLGYRLFRSKRRGAGILSKVLVWVTIAQLILTLMLNGFGPALIGGFIELIYLTVMYVTLDPSLRQERQLQIHLKELEDKADQEEGTLGRDKTGEGYLKIDFFNIFWLFMIGAFAGLIMESLVCPFLNGRIENRTGVLFGPFSPIYGFGAVMMVIMLNRFYNKSPIIIYIVSGIIGGAFEFAVSWFFQFSFGILAWDYSEEFLNIDGRTDLFHILAWGFLGLFFIKIIVPRTLKIINKIPWNWRYSVTTVCATLMIINGGMTLMAFQCWYDRASGSVPDTPVANFFDEKFGDDFMKNHFATMSIDPSRATRR